MTANHRAAASYRAAANHPVTVTSLAFAAVLLLVAARVGLSQPPEGVPESQIVVAKDVAGNQLGAAGDMIGFSHSDASGTQTITLVHTGKSWMAVYHIDKSGKTRRVGRKADVIIGGRAGGSLRAVVRWRSVARKSQRRWADY